MEDTVLLEKAIDSILQQPLAALFEVANRVVGPAMGAINLAHETARLISHATGVTCLRAYVEGYVVHGQNRLEFRRTRIASGERVLIVEDVITTGGSVALTADAITRAGGYVLPCVVALVNRSGQDYIDGRRVISLINRPMPIWSPEECPLCKSGSEALRPKAIGNWEQLCAEY